MIQATYKPEDQKLLDECAALLEQISAKIRRDIDFYNPNTTWQQIHDGITNNPERIAVLESYRELLDTLVPVYKMSAPVDAVEKIIPIIDLDEGFL
jgi:hypothetical protein